MYFHYEIPSFWIYLDFTDRLNAALLSFDIDQNINQLKNVSMSLRALSESTLADRVDNIIDILYNIRDVQIPDIQNQTVSMGRLGNLNKVGLTVKKLTL